MTEIETALQENSLAVFCGNKLIFSSNSKWLHPLFELEEFLQKHQEIKPSECIVYDKIVGKAAALLETFLGFREIHSHIMSSLAVEVFRAYHIKYSSDSIITKIECATEELLQDIQNYEAAVPIIRDRRNKALSLRYERED